MWHVDLSGQGLAEQREALRRDQTQVDAAAARLDAFIDAWQPDAAPMTKSLDAATPEDDLQLALASINGAQTKDLFDPLEQAKAEFDAFVARVRELTSNYARIDTAVDGVALASTCVGWTGDVQSAWRDDMAVEQIAQHRENVHVALARRAMVVRLMVVISTGATKIIIRLATPGAQLLVLPALWQFVRDVVMQLRETQPT